MKWVERIFERLATMYGSVFLDMWSSMDPDLVKQCWADELSGYTADEIAAGLAACKGKSYPPTLPQFLMLCRRPVDPEAAFYEAARQMARRGTGADEWPSPAIYWAAVKIGAFDMRNATWATIKRRWTDVLDEMLADSNLPQVPERVPLLPEPGRTLMRGGGVRAFVDHLQRGDREGWARKTFRRWEAGENVPEHLIKAAEHELGCNRPQRKGAA